MNTTAKPAAVQAPVPPPDQVEGSIELHRIRPSPLNPRKSFPAEGIDQLAASISEQGLLQRLLVRPVGVDGKRPAVTGRGWADLDHFELVDGERRYRALQQLGETDRLAHDFKVKITARWLTDAEALALMLVSNDQREDVRPSEQAAGYAALRATTGNDEAVAALVGKPVSFVRGLLRLGRLPAWALAAVDAGTLPRATAELVARVPGEESRRKCAALVMLSAISPNGFTETCWADDYWKVRPTVHPLSYRDTESLIRNYFHQQLKGAPFDRKSALYMLPGCEPGHERNIQSCEACPKRAGNDAEATAEGTRADVCLDPDCYRTKVEAHDEKEIRKAADKGAERVPDDFVWPPRTPNNAPPRGWCKIDEQVNTTELIDDFGASKKGSDKLLNLLGTSQIHLAPCKVYAALDGNHKLRLLMRTAEARKALQASGVLKKPEPRKPEKRAALPAKRDPAAPKGPSIFDIDERAMQIATRVLGEHGESELSALAGLPDAAVGRPVGDALRLVTRAVAYEWLVSGGNDQLDVLRLKFPDISGSPVKQKSDGDCLNEIACWPAPQCLAFLLQMVSVIELADGPNTDTAEAMLDFAELDWQQLQEQARRELAGGETAEDKVAKVAASFDATKIESIPGMPRWATHSLSERDITTLAQLQALVAKDKSPNQDRRQKLISAMGSIPGDSAGDAADAVLDHLYPGRDKTRKPGALAAPEAPVDIDKVIAENAAVVHLHDLDGFPEAVADQLFPGITTVPTLLEHVDAKVRIDLPLRNKVVTFLVNNGVKIKPAERAADAVAKSVAAPAEAAPAPKTKPKTKGSAK